MPHPATPNFSIRQTTEAWILSTTYVTDCGKDRTIEIEISTTGVTIPLTPTLNAAGLAKFTNLLSIASHIRQVATH